MAVIVAMDGVEFGMYGVCRNFTLYSFDISARYLRLSGIIANHTSFYVVAFSVSAACAALIPHCLLQYSSVVFKCCSADKKARGFLMLVRFFGGSGTVSMWMSFNSCSVISLITCRWCYLVALYIAISCFPDIRVLATSLWLKRCAFNMMSSSSQFWGSSWNLMPILDTFRPSISSFT